MPNFFLRNVRDVSANNDNNRQIFIALCGHNFLGIGNRSSINPL